jgi:hypothetical protein
MLIRLNQWHHFAQALQCPPFLDGIPTAETVLGDTLQEKSACSVEEGEI